MSSAHSTGLKNQMTSKELGMRTENRWLALVVLCVGMLMIVLDGAGVEAAGGASERSEGRRC